VRAFTTGLRLLPGVSIARMDREDIERAQREGFNGRIPDRLAMLVTGRPSEGVEATDRFIPGPGGDLPIRVYRQVDTPGQGSPAVLNLHGGGWVLGNLDSSNWLCSAVAAGTGATVVSVGYRLAPQHPHPAALDDCERALQWLVDHAEEVGIDPARLALMGDSAGGNLAAVTALRLRDNGGPPVASQILIYPGTDLTLSAPSVGRHAHAPVLTRADIQAFRHHYIGDADPKDPQVSPLHAEDLSGLPPTLVQTAEHDPLVDEGRFYAEALDAAGVPVRHTEYVGMPHGFMSFPGVARQAARQALAEICEELQTRLW
jgi:acetyl esterase/lipase